MAILPRATVIAATLTLAGCAHMGRPACSGSVEARPEINRTIHAFFDALRDEDKAAFERLTTKSFYSFDVGKRFVGTQLVDVVRDAHSRGIQLNWSIGPIDTQFDCNAAWSAWENVGSAGVPPEVRPIRWLESAVLVRQNGGWKIDFFHSQRATTP